MLSVVITGASGFLGRHLTALLAKKEDFKVIPVSRKAFPGSVHVRDYSESPEGNVLIHLAEESDRRKANQLGESYATSASKVVANLAKRFQQNLIYASSGMVYGDKNQFPCSVEFPVFGSDWYTKAKIINENTVLDFGGTAMRLCNLFGVGMSSENVMSDILSQLPRTGPVCVRDDKPIRDFLSVSVAVVAFQLVMERKFRGVINIGSGVGTSVRALAELALKVAGQEKRKIVVTEPSDRNSINVLNISETIRNLGWIPPSLPKDDLMKFFSYNVKVTSGKT